MQRSCVLQCWVYLKKRDFQRHKGCIMLKSNKNAGVMYCLVENLLCKWGVLLCFIAHHKFFMMSLQNHNSAQLHSKGLWTLANLLINICIASIVSMTFQISPQGFWKTSALQLKARLKVSSCPYSGTISVVHTV